MKASLGSVSNPIFWMQGLSTRGSLQSGCEKTFTVPDIGDSDVRQLFRMMPDTTTPLPSYVMKVCNVDNPDMSMSYTHLDY